MTDKTKDNTIHLGICMAGAVSAGAYTAGVIDYLLETLDAWENAKARGEKVPTHRILISAISGSSAGGIISVMLPKIFYIDGQPHVSLNKPGQTESEKAGNMLYNTWINFYLNGERNILDDLLDPSDIRESGGLHSLLNSNFKKRIAREVLENTPTNRKEVPPYVEKNLDVIVALTNTSGYTFNVPFKNNNPRGKQPAEDAYTVTTHRDLAHFVVTDEYDPNVKPFQRGKIPYNPKSLLHDDYRPVSDAARGTSAFPVGFISEKMVRPWDIVAQNDLLFKDKSALDEKILPEELKGQNGEPNFVTYNVDAGTVNNEPFEHIKTVLEKRYYRENVPEPTDLKEAVEAGEHIKAESVNQVDFEKKNADPDSFKSTILLIDPLPDTVSSNRFDKTDLKNLIPQLLALLQNQAKFKPELIEEAVDTNDFSKFIIAPRRQGPNKKRINGYQALASGALGAFGGFLNKEYLKHDFYLGRRNCQSFLQHHFVVEASTRNEIFAEAYSDPEVKARFLYRKGNKNYLPIIPDMKYVSHFGTFDGLSAAERKARNVEEIMDYGALPKINEAKLSEWRKMVRKRIRTWFLLLMKDIWTEENEKNEKARPLLNSFEWVVIGLYFYIFKVRRLALVLTDHIAIELKRYGLYDENR